MCYSLSLRCVGALNGAGGVKSFWNELRSRTLLYGLAAYDVYRYTTRGVAYACEDFRLSGEKIMLTFQQIECVMPSLM